MRIAAIVLAAGLGGALAGCTDPAVDPMPTDPPITNEQPTDEPTNEPTEAEMITMEEAGMIATDAHGGTIVTIEADDHNGEATWKVELTGTTDGVSEVEVSQETGEIVAVDGE